MTYEFECAKCEKRFTRILSLEQFEKWKEHKLELDCPMADCRSTCHRVIIGKPGVILGDGFTRRSF